MRSFIDNTDTMHVIDGCLIAPVPVDLDEATLIRFKQQLLSAAHARAIRKVVIDVSARLILDAAEFALFERAARMLKMLGAQTVFTGFQPGVVSALMDLNVDTDGIVSAASVQDGLALLRTRVETPPGDNPDEDHGAQAPDTDESTRGCPLPHKETHERSHPE